MGLGVKPFWGADTAEDMVSSPTPAHDHVPGTCGQLSTPKEQSKFSALLAKTGFESVLLMEGWLNDALRHPEGACASHRNRSSLRLITTKGCR